MKLTREQAIAEHRKMWRWIAEETEKQKRCMGKEDYIYFSEYCTIAEDLLHNCFCCEYAYITANSDLDNMCKFCPIDWRSSETKYMCELKTADEDNFHYLWCDARADRDWELASKLARQIAELPERKELKDDV